MNKLILIIIVAILPMELFSLDSLWTKKIHTDEITQIEISKFDDRFYSTGLDSFFVITNLSDARLIKQFKINYPITSFDLINNEQRILLGMITNNYIQFNTLLYNQANDSNLFDIYNYVTCQNSDVNLNGSFKIINKMVSDSLFLSGLYSECKYMSSMGLNKYNYANAGSIELRNVSNGSLNDSILTRIYPDEFHEAIVELKVLKGKKIFISTYNYARFWDSPYGTSNPSNTSLYEMDLRNLSMKRLFYNDNDFYHTDGTLESVGRLTISIDENFLAGCVNGVYPDSDKIIIWNLNDSNLKKIIHLDRRNEILNLSYSRSGKYIILSCRNSLKILHLYSGLIVDSVITSPKSCIALCSDSNHFLTGNYDGYVNMWTSEFLSNDFKCHFISNITKSELIPTTINFYDISTGNPETWFWDFGDGTNSTLQNPTHTYSKIGTYTVKLVITNKSISDREEKINYITINKYNVVSEPCKNKKSFQVSPNPTNQLLIANYELHEAGYVKLTLVSLLGQEVAVIDEGFKEAGSYHSEFRIQNSELPAGMYFVRLVGGGKVETEKVIIMK